MRQQDGGQFRDIHIAAAAKSHNHIGLRAARVLERLHRHGAAWLRFTTVEDIDVDLGALQRLDGAVHQS
jgi:hypothetical protein